jgi:SAM-dependent methyltransferase
MKDSEIRKAVRKEYGSIAKQSDSCCGSSSSCCSTTALADNISKRIGYTEEDLKAVPEGANLGLGCGNPIAMASLKEGEIVLDLGSGAGFDCFLAATKVGKSGKVIGIDMTPEMIEKARENSEKGRHENVDFRLGEIENLPVADNLVDVIISNCVINLSPNKGRVFEEALRVLRPGGRLMVLDIVLLEAIPDAIRNSVTAYVGCIAGASMRDEYLGIIGSVGFEDIKVIEETSFPVECMINDPTAQAIIKDLEITPEILSNSAKSVVSIKVSATKPL